MDQASLLRECLKDMLSFQAEALITGLIWIVHAKPVMFYLSPDGLALASYHRRVDGQMPFILLRAVDGSDSGSSHKCVQTC